MKQLCPYQRFFTVPRGNLVGKLNEGWAVAITTLAYKRDPIVRQKLAYLWIGEQALQMNAYRSLTKHLGATPIVQPGRTTWSKPSANV